MGYLIGGFIIIFFLGFMTAKYIGATEKCVKCGEGHGKYCSACYHILQAELLALEVEQRNTLRSIEYNRQKKAV